MDESLPLPVNCETPSIKSKQKLVRDKTNIILEEKVISLEEKISVLNEEITALRYFITEQLLLIKTMAKEKSTDSSYVTQTSSLMKQNIWEKKIIPKNCIIQTLIENQKKYLEYAWFENTRY